MNAEFNKMRTDLANNFASAGAALLDYMTIDGTKTAALAAIPESDPQQYAIAGTLAGIAQMLPKAVPGVEAIVERSGNELHNAIMNLPAKHAEDFYATTALAYKVGHRDARHAAAELSLAATTQASTAQAEPVMWFEAEPSARGLEAKDVIGSMLYSTRIHTGAAPITSNPVWPLYAAQLTATSSTDAQAAAEVRDAWISVDERLPENGVDVIILHWPYDNRENQQVADTAHHVDGVFYDEDGNDMHPPSHWMPLNLPVALRSAGDTGGA